MTTYTELTDENFYKVIAESRKPTLVMLHADWSGSCHIMAPVIEVLLKEYDGKIRFGKLDVEANPRVAQAYDDGNLPILLFLKDGKLVDRSSGALPRAMVSGKLMTLLNRDKK